MNESTNHQRWQLAGNPVLIPGFGYGCRYPSLIVSVKGDALSETSRTQLANTLREIAKSPDEQVEEALVNPVAIPDPWLSTLSWLFSVVHHLQRAAGLPIFERGRPIAASPGQATLVVPVFGRAIQSMIDLWPALFALFDDQAIDPLRNALTALQKAIPSATNTPRFLRAAFDLGLSFQELPGEVVQYGIGRRHRWLASSFTDESSRLGAWLARDKQIAAQMLRRAGVPVPAHHLVLDAAAAVQAAEELGYPVVVKPADLDGGIGIFVRLVSPEEVRDAFEKAREHSPHVLVEKYVEGRDYRVVVFQGETIWAIERVPGGVTGDGVHTVEQLVEMTNAERLTAWARPYPKPIPLDDEARSLIARAGLQWSSIPDAGQFVRLRRAANIASGGTPVAVFDQVHPDNRALAVRAAEALRLDLAGIDLLIPDISRSWRETGAAICEVNAQPELGQVTSAHLYPLLLQRLIPGDGRIPTVVILGAAPKSKLAKALELALAEKGFSVGCHDNEGVRIKGDVLLEGNVSPFAAGSALVANQRVGALILSVNDIEVLRSGLPFARYDVLVVAGPFIEMPPNASNEQRQKWMVELFAGVLPACDGKVVELEATGLQTQGLRALTRMSWSAVPAPKLITSLVSDVVACEAKHQKTRE